LRLSGVLDLAAINPSAVQSCSGQTFDQRRSIRPCWATLIRSQV